MYNVDLDGQLWKWSTGRELSLDRRDKVGRDQQFVQQGLSAYLISSDWSGLEIKDGIALFMSTEYSCVKERQDSAIRLVEET